MDYLDLTRLEEQMRISSAWHRVRQTSIRPDTHDCAVNKVLAGWRQGVADRPNIKSRPYTDSVLNRQAQPAWINTYLHALGEDLKWMIIDAEIVDGHHVAIDPGTVPDDEYMSVILPISSRQANN